MANLRAGLVGLGMIGRHHARVLRAVDGVDLVAVADGTGDVHGVAGELPLLPDVEAIIAAGVDYCVVAVPTRFHTTVALQLAEAGVHALIEKPLAQSGADARTIADAFERAGLVGGVGHIERYNPALQSLRQRLADGDLGEVYQIATRRQGPFPARIADVGVVKDLASHDFDLTAWVSGQGYRSVSARAQHRSGREHEDMVAVTAELADGTMANHLVNWLTPTKERVTVVTGEKGMFVADTLLADLTFYGNAATPSEWEEIAQFRGVSEGDVIRFAIPKPEPLRTEHEVFRDAVLGHETDLVTLRQGAAVVRVCDAVIESVGSGQVVDLEESS